MKHYRIGIDVGGTKIACGLFDAQYNLISRRTEPSRPDLSGEGQLDYLCELVDALLAENGLSRGDLACVGLGLPGHIHFDRGVMINSSNLPKWKGVAVRDALSDRLGVKVLLDNDANVAGLAEFYMGAGKGSKNMVYLTISTGIGCGLILNGKMFRGTYGAAGEIGHTFIRSASRIVCGCGRVGCAEAIGSGTAVARYVKARLCEGAKSVLSKTDLEDITAHHVAEAAKQGDALALEALDVAADAIAQVFYNVCQLFGCDCIVYGGGLTKIGPLLMDRVFERFHELLPSSADFPVFVKEAALGDETGILGAALLAEEL